MIERREHSPTRRIIEHLLAIQTDALSPSDARIAALYGTSLEGLTYLIQTGTVINFESEGKRQSELRVIPTLGMGEKLFNDSQFGELFDDERVRSDALAQAHYAGRLDCFLPNLSLARTDSALQDAAMEYLYHTDAKTSSDNLVWISSDLLRKKSIQRFQQVLPENVSPQYLDDIAIEASQRQGILLGIDISAAFDIVKIEGDVTVKFKNRGKSFYKSLVALEAVGEREKEFMQKLGRL